MTGYKRISELDCFYRVEGIGEPIILLHGWGQSHSFWNYFYDELTQDYKIYSFDFPGFGLSQEPQKIWGVEDYSEFLKEFTKTLKIRDFILVGHSFGGRVATFYAANNNDVSRLVLYSASGVSQQSLLRLLPYFFLLILTKIAPKLSYYLQCTLFKPSEYQNKFLNTSDRSEMLAKIYSKTHKSNLSDLAAKIRCKTLLIYGGSDWIVPSSMGLKYQKLIPWSNIFVLPDAGHFAHIKNRKKFFSLLKDI